MPVTMELNETVCLIRLEGAVNLISAGEVKKLLLEGLASEKDVELDLEGVEEIDITMMQLLWAAGRGAEPRSARLVIRLSDAVSTAARDAGFGRFPGEMGSGLTNV